MIKRVSWTMLAFVLLAACTSESEPGAPGPSSTDPIAGTEIEEFRAAQPDHWQASGSNWAITLTWKAPAATVDHYVLSRNGSIVVNDLTTTEYHDASIWPGAAYTYTLEAVGSDADHSKPAKVRIKTGTPSLAEARLDGDYDVRLTPVSYANTTSPKPFEARFTFRPTCPSSEGACDVRWGEHYGTATGILARSGASYRGTAHGTFILGDCHGNKVDETIAISVKVVAARPTGGRTWEAYRIEGTLADDSPVAPGCSGSVSIDWTFKSS